MIRFLLISLFVFILLSACEFGNKENSEIQNYILPPVKATIFGSYHTKPPKELFYTDQTLTLNSDYTFNYNCESCIGIDTCSGNWTLKNNLITLKTSDKYRNAAKKTAFTLDRVKAKDLNNQIVIVDVNYLLLSNLDSKIDTLIKK